MRFTSQPGHSLELVVSSVSLTMERANTIDQQSSVQVLVRLASNAKLFRSADGRFCAQVPVGDRLEIYRLLSADLLPRPPGVAREDSL